MVHSSSMKHFLILAALVLLPFGVADAAYYLKLDGVDGETSASTPETATLVAPTTTANEPARSDPGSTGRDPVTDAAPEVEAARPTSETGSVTAPAAPPQEASTDYLLKLGGVEGESAPPAPGVEPDEIDVATTAEPLTPDFSILLGGGGDTEQADTRRQQIADVLLSGAQKAGKPAETMSLNYEKIKVKARQRVKLFGVLPMTIPATVDIDASGQTSVTYPWWSILVSGDDAGALGQDMVLTLLAVMESKREEIVSILAGQQE